MITYGSVPCVVLGVAEKANPLDGDTLIIRVSGATSATYVEPLDRKIAGGAMTSAKAVQSLRPSRVDKWRGGFWRTTKTGRANRRRYARRIAEFRRDHSEVTRLNVRLRRLGVK